MRRHLALTLAFVLIACSGEPRDARSSDDEVPADDARAGDTADDSGPATNGDAGDAGGSIDPNAPLTPDGWGPLRIGMTRAEVERVAGPDAHPERVGGPEPEVCDEFRPERVPEGMLLMLENGVLTRITLMRDARVETERGFGIGDRASDVLDAYGDAAVSTPHKYRDAPSAYITVWSVPPGGEAPARGIVYDVGDDGRVALVHAGGASIQYVEGCL